MRTVLSSLVLAMSVAVAFPAFATDAATRKQSAPAEKCEHGVKKSLCARCNPKLDAVYKAKGGFQEASIGIATARDLNGNLLDGGFAVGVGALYSRLFGSAAKTPITSIRGSRNQWTFGGGLAYTF